MNIGVIGAGNMARVLGKRWAEKGHKVFFGSREQSRAQQVAIQVGHGARAGSFAEAAQFGEAVLLAVSWEGVANAIALAGPLTGKIIIDCNNAVDLQQHELALGFTTSYAEEIAQAAAGSKVVKAFSTIFRDVLEREEEDLRAQHVACFICGDDADAKAVVASLAREIGVEPVDVGLLRTARLVEPATALMIQLVWERGFSTHAALSVQQLPLPAPKPHEDRD
jgi:NADPH-dependent F420 reductase